MANLNRHATRNGAYSQGDTFGNLPFLDTTIVSTLKKASQIFIVVKFIYF
jgi:hypothetical protein